MKDKCKICERDTGGFEYCNEFCEIQGLRSQLEDARELEKKAFWSGFELSKMNPDDMNIQKHWRHYNQLKEQGDE